MKPKNELGKKYGRLTVLCESGSNHKSLKLWRCRCSCGNETTVVGSSLRNKTTTSCGCLQKDIARSHILKIGKRNAIDYYDEDIIG